MKPILYEETEMEFENNGLGIMGDAARCSIQQDRTGVFEMEMDYPVEGIHYGELALRRILLAKPDNTSRTQPFRIYEISRPMGGTVTVYARHVAYDLMGIPVSPFTSGSCSEAMVKLKTKAATECPFTFWTDKTTVANMTVDVPSSIWSILGGSAGGILDVYGGEYEFDRWTVKLHANRGTNRGVSIRYGKNLTDLTQEEKCSSVYTGLYPYWADTEGNVTELPEKIVKAEGTFSYTRILPIDFSQEWQEQPTEERLRARAERYIRENDIGVPSVSLDVSFVQLAETEEYKDLMLLEQVGLCDTVNVAFPRLGVSATAKCISTTYNVLTERYEKIEIGDARSTFAKAVTDLSESAAADKASVTDLKKAIESATKLITGSKGGRVVIITDEDGRPTELCILTDSEDITTATSLWRWNESGLGYSKEGYEGEYALALTRDGAIVADRITTGTLNAEIIKAGTLTDAKGKNYWNMETGELYMESGTIQTRDVNVAGKLSTYDDSKKTMGGYVGYMTGSTGTETTTGIGVSNADGKCYVIATDSGTRMQAGSANVHVTAEGAAEMNGSGGKVAIWTGGIYIEGSLYHRKNGSDEWKEIT